MKRILIALLLAAQTIPALADDFVARRGSDFLRLTLEPCSQAVRDAHGGRIPEVARAGTAQVDGKSYITCWVTNGVSVRVAFDDGDVSPEIPLQAFEVEKGV